jgi:cell division septal protein FtsQ
MSNLSRRHRKKHEESDRKKHGKLWQRALSYLVLALAFYVTFPGEIIKEGRKALSNFQQKDNFSLHEIKISGNTHLKEEDILHTANIYLGKNMGKIKPWKIKSRLEENGWIESSEVRKIYPSTLHIHVVESTPSAIWWHAGKFYIVTFEGNVIDKINNIFPESGYKLLVGRNAPKEYKNIYQLLQEHDFFADLISLEYVGDRRWNLYFASKLLVKLPEENIDDALKVFSAILKKDNALLKSREIDLTLAPLKVFVKK